VSEIPSVIDAIPYMMPSDGLNDVLASVSECTSREECRLQFLGDALGSGSLSLGDLNDVTEALGEPATVEFSVDSNCTTTSALILNFSEPVIGVDGLPFSVADLSVAIDGADAADAVVSPLAAPGAYALDFGQVFAGNEELTVQIPANQLVGARYGVVPAHSGTLRLSDCVAPVMDAVVAGSDAMPLESAPTGADGYTVPANTIVLTFSEPVLGATADGVVGADFLVEVSDPTVNTTFTVVSSETIALAYGGKVRRLQSSLATKRVALGLNFNGSEPVGGELVRITPLTVRDEAGNRIFPASYAVLGSLSSTAPETPSASAGITTSAGNIGNIFQCTTLEAGLLIIVSFMFAHAMLYGAGVLLPYVARAEHVAKYGRVPSKQRFAPRWGPAIWAVALILCVALVPMVALGHVAAMSYTAAFFPLWLMLLAIAIKEVRKTRKEQISVRAKPQAALPAILPLLHLAFGIMVCLIVDYPHNFSNAGVRIAAMIVFALGIVVVSVRLVLHHHPDSASHTKKLDHFYRRALARHAVGLFLLITVVTITAIRLDWTESCQDSWAWVLLPLLCALGLLLLQQLLRRLLPRCFTASSALTPTPQVALHQELPAELAPTSGDAQLMLQKVMDRALAEGRSLTEVADEMLNQSEVLALEMPSAIMTAIGKEFQERNGRRPVDEAEALAFLKDVVQQAQQARVEQQELLRITVPEDVVDKAHVVLMESGVSLTAEQTNDVMALRALSDKLALDIAGFDADDFESRLAADKEAAREALELKHSVDAYLDAKKRVEELEVAATLPEGVASAIEAAFGDPETVDCEEVFRNAADVPAVVVTAAEIEFEKAQGRDPADTAEAISFIKSVVHDVQQARVEQRKIEVPEVPNEILEKAHEVLIERAGDMSVHGTDDADALKALSDKLAFDLTKFETRVADSEAAQESFVLKRSVDAYLDAQKRVAELEKVAVPDNIAFAVEAEFAQRADGHAEKGDPLEVLQLCTQIVDEYVLQTKSVLVDEAAGSGALARSAHGSKKPSTEVDIDFNTHRMDLEFQTDHGFAMLEENEDDTVERISFRRNDHDAMMNSSLKPDAVKKATEADKTRSTTVYENARAAPVLRPPAPPVLMSDEAKAQVKAAVARMEKERAAIETGSSTPHDDAEVSGLANATAQASPKSILIPAALLTSGLVVIVVAGVLAGVLGSGSAAPSVGVGIGVSIGVAGVIAVGLIAYRIRRHYRNQKLKMLSQQLRRTSRASIDANRSPVLGTLASSILQSARRSAPIPDTVESLTQSPVQPSGRRSAPILDTVESLTQSPVHSYGSACDSVHRSSSSEQNSNRSEPAQLDDDERLQARVDRVTLSNHGPSQSRPMPHRLPPLTKSPSTLIMPSTSSSKLDKTTLSGNLAARLSAAKHKVGDSPAVIQHRPPPPTPPPATSSGSNSPSMPHRVAPINSSPGTSNFIVKHRTAPVAPIARATPFAPGSQKLLPVGKLPPLEHRPTRAPPRLSETRMPSAEDLVVLPITSSEQ